MIDMEPLITQFFTSLVIGLLVSRILWIFESQLMYNLMLGYELDRALILRKSEKSFFEMDTSFLCWSASKKISDMSKNDSGLPTSSYSNTLGQGNICPVEERMMLKGLEKYGKLKNKAELDAEIGRVKEEICRHQVELVCLENMIFASEHDSKSQSGRKSSHGQALPNSKHSQGESGCNEGNQALNNELENGISCAPSPKNLDGIV